MPSSFPLPTVTVFSVIMIFLFCFIHYCVFFRFHTSDILSLCLSLSDFISSNINTLQMCPVFAANDKFHFNNTFFLCIQACLSVNDVMYGIFVNLHMLRNFKLIHSLSYLKHKNRKKCTTEFCYICNANERTP